MKRAVLLTLSLTLLSGCGALAAFGTEPEPVPAVTESERTLCRELRADLPSWSAEDTPTSLEEGARFIEVFEGLCPI